MKTKTFDCVEMKRRGAASVQKKLENKSYDQILAFWRKGTNDLKILQKRKQGEIPR
ncbi:MAG: hypothetical protein JW709_01155 [Sedimentisphaerales bacterium]|nr:hypothetical protein [Sedimentisphaerales bacterium]